jgi:hypothetical protein
MVASHAEDGDVHEGADRVWQGAVEVAAIF